MGLDMYAFTTSLRPSTDVDFRDLNDAMTLHYWRKHWRLHRWIERLYRERGGADPDFNLATVVLERADLDALKALITLGTSPFCRGESYSDNEFFQRQRNQDLMFVRNARRAIETGKTVFYLASY